MQIKISAEREHEREHEHRPGREREHEHEHEHRPGREHEREREQDTYSRTASRSRTYSRTSSRTERRCYSPFLRPRSPPVLRYDRRFCALEHALVSPAGRTLVVSLFAPALPRCVGGGRIVCEGRLPCEPNNLGGPSIQSPEHTMPESGYHRLLSHPQMMRFSASRPKCLSAHGSASATTTES